ncbi:MAG TPA: inositol monophosphatase family protein [Actinomycetota bacterium]|nr:inositol monophosphatase family protein [Actinomycetota bacterium]
MREGRTAGTTKAAAIDDLELAMALADAAAAVTLPSFGERLPVELKEDDTPVTAVDRGAERAIRQVLGERAPDDGVLGEEEGHAPGADGRTWVIDPVDGTKLFAEGIPLWTTLIALTIDGEPVVGVADAPALGVRYHATRHGGAWCGTRPLVVSGIVSLVDALVAHSPIEEWYRSGDGGHLADLASAARGTRGLSDAWAHLLVAQGSVEALVEHEPCYAWDWSATQVIVEEAGGRITTLDGGSPTPGSNLLVSNGLVHDEVVAVLTEGST